MSIRHTNHKLTGSLMGRVEVILGIRLNGFWDKQRGAVDGARGVTLHRGDERWAFDESTVDQIEELIADLDVARLYLMHLVDEETR